MWILAVSTLITCTRFRGIPRHPPRVRTDSLRTPLADGEDDGSAGLVEVGGEVGIHLSRRSRGMVAPVLLTRATVLLVVIMTLIT
jgi:hypothetical protein